MFRNVITPGGLTVFTWGYSGGRIDELERLRFQLGGLVVDTRFSPRSRIRQWNRGPLEQRFGVDYLWVQEFGNMNWKAGGPIVVLDPGGGAARLKSLVTESRPPILLCACANVETCHRAVVAEYLGNTFGWNIEHLPTMPIVPRGRATPD